MFSFAPKPEKLKEKGDIEGLMKLLDHKKTEIRKEVAQILRDVAKPECLPGLMKAMTDENAGVRVCGVQGIARLRDPQTDSALEKATNDPDWEVQKEALSAIVKAGRNVEVMLRAMRFNSAELRELAAMRLGDFGGPEVVNALMAALEDEEELVRLRAVNSLAKINDSSAQPSLEQATKDKDPQVSKAAIAALEALRK